MMLDFEQRFKIMVTSRWTVSEILLTSAIIAFKVFCIETRMSNIFRTKNVTKLTEAILERCYRVLVVKCKQKTLNPSVYFLRVDGFCSTLTFKFTKRCRTTIFLKHASIHINRATHYKITTFLKSESFVFFGRLFIQNKTCRHFEFLMKQIFGQRFFILKN